MKKSLALALVFIFVMGVFGTAIAAQPDFEATILITSASGEFKVEVDQALALTATWTTNRDVTREQWLVGEDVKQSANVTTGSTGSSDFTFDATGLPLGFYDVTYRIWHHTQLDREGMETIVMEVYEDVIATVYVDPMAAPAVASQILKFNGIAPRYGKGKTGGNFIADVAKYMGPQTMFDGVPKAIWDETAEQYVSNPEYWDTVLAFLNAHNNMTVELEPAYNWYIANLK